MQQAIYGRSFVILGFKNNKMKLFSFLILLIFIIGFSSCESYRQTHDIVQGTPSRADTVLPHKFSPAPEAKTSATENTPKVFER